MHNILLPLLLLLGTLPTAQAHDPGLSRAGVQLRANGLALHMVFARKDMAALLPLDTNHDGTVTDAEITAAPTRLQSALAAGVEAWIPRGRLQPVSVRLRPATSDAVHADLVYEHPGGEAIRLDLPLIDRLARGHRQYLTVLDADGELRAQYLLDAASPPVLLQGLESDAARVFRQYLAEGVRHIWIGFDHILFLLTLLLPAVLVYRNTRWRSVDELRPAAADVVKVVTAFTLAHSITLALVTLELVTLPPRLVESVIAFSVLVTALHNLRPLFPASRWLLAFGFGLVHGFGFAGVLANLGLPKDALFLYLLGFNLGVEAGQLAIVALVFPLTYLLRHTLLYRTWVFRGGSAAAAVVAAIWTLERVFAYDILGL